MGYSNSSIEQKLWFRISCGESRDDIAESGKYFEADIALFFEEYHRLISKYRRKQDRITESARQKTEESNAKFKDEWERGSSKSKFLCPRCEKGIMRHQFMSHLNEDHPFDPPPSVSDSKYEKWYYEYISQQAKINYIKHMIKYTPSGGQSN